MFPSLIAPEAYYLAHGAVVTGSGLLALWLFPPGRRAMLLCGLLAAPLGLADALFVPEYWNPPHLLSKNFSVEGLLFSFGHGILLCFVAFLPFWRRCHDHPAARRIFQRIFFCTILGGVTFMIVWRYGPGPGALPIMEATLVALLVTGAFMLWRRPDAWPFVVSGAAGFGVIYALELALLTQIVPGYVSYWSAEVRSGTSFAGFPIEELWWATIYGGVWALAAAYGGDLYLVPRNASKLLHTQQRLGVAECCLHCRDQSADDTE